jgi:GT2 family glycosyltransferase
VPEVAVVVLTFDPPDGLFEACIASVAAAGGWQRLVVVDNGGRARARLAALAEPVEFDLVAPGTNLGFAGGMNLGIEHAIARGATHVMLLNDDATVGPGWIESLLGELVGAEQHRERLGAVQPMLVFATDPPTVNSMGVALGRDGAGTDVGYGSPVPEIAAGPHDIGIFTGGAVLLSAAFLADVGAFDARFFLYYEDVDLALRGAERGWRYRCVPGVQVRHVGSASTGRRPDVAVYHRERNRLWVLFRHRPWGDIGRGLWLSVRRLRHEPRGVHARALLAGLAAAPRLLRARRH